MNRKNTCGWLNTRSWPTVRSARHRWPFIRSTFRLYQLCNLAKRSTSCIARQWAIAAIHYTTIVLWHQVRAVGLGCESRKRTNRRRRCLHSPVVRRGAYFGARSVAYLYVAPQEAVSCARSLAKSRKGMLSSLLVLTLAMAHYSFPAPVILLQISIRNVRCCKRHAVDAAIQKPGRYRHR